MKWISLTFLILLNFCLNVNCRTKGKHFINVKIKKKKINANDKTKNRITFFPVQSVCNIRHQDDICSFGESNFVIRYYYDRVDNKCYPFNFDNECSSDGNVFQTKDECEHVCKKSTSDAEIDAILLSSFH